jgi:hypothetical protein
MVRSFDLALPVIAASLLSSPSLGDPAAPADKASAALSLLAVAAALACEESRRAVGPCNPAGRTAGVLDALRPLAAENAAAVLMVAPPPPPTPALEPPRARLVLAARGDDDELVDVEPPLPLSVAEGAASTRPPGEGRGAGMPRSRDGSRDADPLRKVASARRPLPALPEGGGGGRERTLLLVRTTPGPPALPPGPAPGFSKLPNSSSICFTRMAVAACLARADAPAPSSKAGSAPPSNVPAKVSRSLRKSAACVASAV